MVFTLVMTSWSMVSAEAKTAPVIYGISPYYFVRGYNIKPFEAIKHRLPEIKKLGVNILWLQPIFLSAEEGQGYDTIDFFKINPAFGTDEDFRSLIAEAHELGLKVILDIALNHTSLKHPFASDVVNIGANSRYFDFYQHLANPDVPYSQHFNLRKEGEGTFIYYFWDKLVNLNYSSKKVQQYAVEVTSYWIKEYNVDGYRFDAGWGPSSRWPLFYKTINDSLRKIKKDIILIAEDKANYPAAYKSFKHPHLANSGFDLAYDWNSEDPDWMSKWTFQTGDNHHETIFNSEDKKIAARHFANALKIGMKKGAVPTLRYLENNDTGSFLQSHSRRQTKWAAASMIFLPGSPLLFYGQAEGINYSQWNLPALDPAIKLKNYDEDLWTYYYELLSRRAKLKSFEKITEVKILAGNKVRYTVDEKIVIENDFEKETLSVINSL